MKTQSLHLSFDSPLGWVILGIIAIIFIALVGFIFYMQIKGVVTTLTVLIQGISKFLHIKVQNESDELKIRYIKQRGHVVKCEYCNVEHTFIKTSDIPSVCPNCGAPITYIEPKIDEKEIKAKIKEFKVIGIVLLPFGILLLIAIIDMIIR